MRHVRERSVADEPYDPLAHSVGPSGLFAAGPAAPAGPSAAHEHLAGTDAALKSC